MNSPIFAPSRRLSLGLCLVLLSCACAAVAEDAPKLDARYPFRTDFANANLPWYQPQPREFPPHHSDRRIGGELVSADFIHRIGQFRMSKTGELVEFTMPPYGAVNYLNAEADLREVPLGTFFLFFLNQDANGEFTRLATMQDQFTMDASHSFSYRLEEAKLGEGKLLTTKQSIPKNQPDLGKTELLVKDETRVWKGGQQVKLADLAAGDELLFNLTGRTADSPGWCTDIWVGAETHQLATEGQRKKFTEFTKRRGVPGWIDKTEGNVVTVTFFSGDPRTFKQTWMSEFAAGQSGGKLCVANDELRTWNPPVDGEGFSIVEVRDVPKESYGCSGVQIAVRVTNMLEGFRRGRVVRAFAPGWKAQDQFYGESLMGYGFDRIPNADLKENPPKEYPDQFPFRTDFGNANLSWYQLQPGVTPPRYSEHVVFGEVVKVDAANRRGQFKMERTGEVVDFTLLEQGTSLYVDAAKNPHGPARIEPTPVSVRYLGANATLADLSPGLRCRFHLYQDEKGAFTKASFISDDFSSLTANATTYRVEELRLDGGKIRVAHMLPDATDYNGDKQRPPDIARSELLVTAETRVWKGEEQVKLSDLAVGDALRVNLTGELPGQPAHCTDIWIGADTHKLVAERQSKKLVTKKK
jgi:hypothetical protein